ncbi:MAG: DUF1538 domain-containing protein [Clostridia bacterium]|nr:DUF1538 domain-containing protein [Clostridia bacterium]
MNLMKDKLHESLSSVLPIALIVFLLSITLIPLNVGTMLMFIIGTALLVIGMSLFTIGAEMSMQPLGTKIGSSMASTGKIWLIAFISFVIGVIITVSEPDLQILANQVPGIENIVLILTVSIGVGIFLIFGALRIVFGVDLNVLLIIFYITAFTLAFFLPESFRPMAFDSGGVTTGPMTVPFIMSFGAGVSAVRRGKGSGDSFGLTALASVGPIIATLVLGIVINVEGGNVQSAETLPPVNTQDGISDYLEGLAHHLPDVLAAIAPMIVFTVIFQLISRAFSKKQLIRLGVGFAYVVVGLALFITGADVGFLPTGAEIGKQLATLYSGALLIPVAMLLGFFIVKAEPAVYVLNKQVEKMTAGAVSGKTTGLGLSLGVAAALGLSALRVMTGIPIMYILIPGYIAALGLTFFVPKLFVGIAFDSGGVASGIMMSAFVLPLATGACLALGGDVMRDAFGCVAFVAMAPIIAIEVCGLVYKINSKKNAKRFISVSEGFVEYEYSRERRYGAYGEGAEEKKG